MFFSIIVPVFNRPNEINELLESLIISDYKDQFEIVIIEDGSTVKCNEIVENFSHKLQISYYFKTNSGPGDSRNFGMRKAKGDYFIIFDSDCIIPSDYLSKVRVQLQNNYLDCFGGPDKALKSFSNIQKAINFSMTSFLTTGGIRGGSERIAKFQPRSFNMGISKKAFIASKGFGNIHPGEDPDLSIRLWNLGFETGLFLDCFVYHKRRIDWEKFELQVSKFGKARPILNNLYPEHSKITFWFPTLFIIGFILSIVLLFFLIDIPLKLYCIYFLVIFIVSSIQNINIIIGFLSVKAVIIQFFGYGLGFMKSIFKINILNKKPELAFPELFFKKSTITKIIGLTGGIGSGKTTIANYIKSLGIPVYISDEEAKLVMNAPQIITKIVDEFSAKILNSDGTLNRSELASIVFANPEKLKKLNAIVHPEVKKHFDNWLETHKTNPIIVKEAAILFESGSYKDCDFVITVTASIENRIDRVVNRDKTTKEAVLQRINNQILDEERIKLSQFVIKNDTEFDYKHQVDEIIKILKKE